MKLSPFFIMLLIVICCSCNEETKKPAAKNLTDTLASPPKKMMQSGFNFESPIHVGNSDYVMYPLSIRKDGSGGGFITKSSDRAAEHYWNFAFYNTATGEHHLLDKARKMLISTYNTPQQSDTDFVTQKTSAPDSLIYYSVRITDYDNDGELNYSDPEYLFTSDKKGMSFKQISPDNLNVVSWQAISNNGKILIQAVTDINNDKKFDGDDKIIPYVYDLKTNKLTQVFSEDFVNGTSNLFEKHWAVKK